jgi:hypothetical protein
MDRIVASKWFFYVVIGLAVAYLRMYFGTPHFDPFF